MKRSDPKVVKLAELPLFAGCTRKELTRIAQLTFQAECAAGERLCTEGETGEECFIVLEGNASVTMAGTHVATIAPGGFVGEMAVLDGGPRVATVTALTGMRLLVLSRQEFDALLMAVPDVARRMLAIMGSRLRVADRVALRANGFPTPGSNNGARQPV